MPAANVQLASWLVAHRFTEGLSGYWTSSSVTVDSAGDVAVRALVPNGVLPEMWMTDGAWYNPQVSAPNFIVVDLNPGFYNYWAPLKLIRQQFGSPTREESYLGYLILVYHKNLLLGIPGSQLTWPDGQATAAPDGLRELAGRATQLSDGKGLFGTVDFRMCRSALRPTSLPAK